MKLHAVKLPLPENNSRGQNLKAINLIRSNKVFVEIEIKTMTLIYGTNKLKLKLTLLFLWCFAWLLRFLVQEHWEKKSISVWSKISCTCFRFNILHLVPSVSWLWTCLTGNLITITELSLRNQWTIDNSWIWWKICIY